MPGSVWVPLGEVPGLQMIGLTGLGSEETHSCLRSCWAGVTMGHFMSTGGRYLVCGQTGKSSLRSKKRSKQGPNQGNEGQTAGSQTFHTALFWKSLLLGYPTTKAAAWTPGNMACGQG